MGNTIWRTEPISVEKLLDDLRVGAVSYTHLDVYKRQAHCFNNQSKSFFFSYENFFIKSYLVTLSYGFPHDISFGIDYRYENRVVHHYIEIENAELIEQNA